MSFLNKFGIGAAHDSTRQTPSRPVNNSRVAGATAAHAAPASGVPKPASASESNRVSNGLKELLWNLEGLGRGTLLDLGSAWQTTLSFFIERGFRVTSEDLLRAWKDFLVQEDAMLRQAGGRTPDGLDVTPVGRATRFLDSNLKYPPASFDAVLLWDLADYMEPALAGKTVAAVTELLRPGGVVFAMFHSKKPEGFQRYRVVDSNSLQVVASPLLCPAQKIYQNREIQDLFGRYRTMKSFVGRDQLRETLFIK